MSSEYLNWGPEKPSDVQKGGNFRRAGEEEPDILQAKGLSEAEIANRPEVEALEKKEREMLKDALIQMNWHAGDAYGNKKAVDMLFEGVKHKVRYHKIEDYLKEMAVLEASRKFGRKDN